MHVDDSYMAVTYSMPVNYKNNGRWVPIDTSLVQSGNKAYRTASTDLTIKVAKK